MDIYSKHFVEIISDYIIVNEITPTAFAKGVGCLDRCVARWLSGVNTPSIEYAIKVADFLNCSLDYLFGLTDDPKYKKAEISVPFSERLTFLMKKTKTNKLKLSKICEVSSSTVSKWVLHRQLPKPDIACLLANHFNCSVDFLFVRSDNL